MDPLTAALLLATKITEAYLAFLQGATPEQRTELVQHWLDDRKVWRNLLERLKVP